MKKRKLRKPRRLELKGRHTIGPLFSCDTDEAGRTVYFDYCCRLSKHDADRFAKWFTAAAAWLREQENNNA